MTITSRTQAEIIALTDSHWSKHVKDSAFTELISGKEPGHRMADYVDDRTTSLLKVNLDTRYEGDGKGTIKKRSMGDVWIRSRDMYNPVNVKSGLQAMNGQPNLVSMQKLLDYIFRRWIDAYYLLIIKFDVSDEISHSVHLVDLLEWTDFITYDAGPGQIMLREKDFNEAFSSGHRPASRTIVDKAEALFGLFEQQVNALIANRKIRLERQRGLFADFDVKTFVVDQSAMEFVP